MIITLKGATFTNNIGTLDTYRVSISAPAGSTISATWTEDDSSKDNGGAARFHVKKTVTNLSITITMTEGSYNANGLTQTMNNGTLSGSINSSHVYSVSNVTITGNINIYIPAAASSGGGSTTNYTFTINPTPTSATVTLSATGYSTVSGTGSKSITVANGITVNWSVSQSGYTPQQGTWTANGKNESKSVKLDQASVGEVTTFFTSGTQGSKKESTLYGFTWVMPKQFLTSRVNAITVPVYLYKDEYEYVDIICEIMEPQATGSTAAPTKKEGLCAVTRMTADGNAVFNISFDASDIVADQCLIGVRPLDNKKLAFKDTTGSSDWKTATANTGSAKADPCCTYYATAAGAWASSTGVNTRYLELSTDKTATTKYILNASGTENGLVRTSSNYGCIGGIASGADIYTNDVLNLQATSDNVVVVDDNANFVNMPLTVTGNVSMAVLKLDDDGMFFENGTAGGGGKDDVSTTTFNGWLWPMPKKYITAPVSQVSVPSLTLRDAQVPVTITCELLDSNRNVINGKTVTETVSNASGGHDFNLAFTRNDIAEDWCYIAIYVDGDSKTANSVFAFDKVASTAEWFVEINDKTKYPPYYKGGTNKNWASSSSCNQRHIALKTSI